MSLLNIFIGFVIGVAIRRSERAMVAAARPVPLCPWCDCRHEPFCAYPVSRPDPYHRSDN